MKLKSDERDRTGHLTIKPSAIEAKASVSFLNWYFSHNLHIPTLTSACHSMHDKYDGYVLLICRILEFVDPIKANMAAVSEEYFFSIVLSYYVLGIEFINRLNRMIKKPRGWPINIRWYVYNLFVENGQPFD